MKMNSQLRFLKRKILRLSLLSCAVMFVSTNMIAQGSTTRIHKLFDEGWSFKKDNVATGPEKAVFDASDWQKVDLPHDWSIEDLPNQTPGSIQGPFSKEAVSGHHTGYTVGGTAWYRKTFTTQPEDKGKTVYIQFDGVYMNAKVWINGHYLGNQPYGYTPFYYDLTPYLLPAGKDNLIAVQVKNEGNNSRWYTGSGINRHVWLTKVNPVHVDVWGVYVTTPKVSKTTAEVQLISTIKNVGKSNSALTVVNQLIDSKGKIVATTRSNVSVSAENKVEVTQKLSMKNPQLWSPETPYLYKAKTIVLINGKVSDETFTTFGVRDIVINAEQGLLINGNPVKLKGGCLHHDNGPLGTSDLERANERKISILKANGFNAVRCSHNPPSQSFLDICDRLGMLVIDEAFDMWNKAKTAEDYHIYFNEWWNKDLTNIIHRDRNHPSVFLWSVGNEIPERADSIGLATRKILVQRVRELDPSRKVTEAIHRTANWEKKTPAIFQELDVCGYNYQWTKYESDHQSFPQRVMVGTESYPTQLLENWQMAEKHPYVLGDFVWTAFDYIGESILNSTATLLKSEERKITEWPSFNSNVGDFDLIGNKKPQSYYHDVVWRNSKIEMLVKETIPENKVEYVDRWGWPEMHKSWNWSVGKVMQVIVYSRCETVKLELNGKVIGEQKIPENSITATFSVPYQSGTLTARGFDNGKEVAFSTLKSTGKPVAIRLTPDRNKIKADKQDLCYVAVEIIDSEGNIVPNAEDFEINYTISENGRIVGVGNGNPVDVTSFQQPHKKVFHGRGLVIIQSVGKSGKIRLSAQSIGLSGASVGIINQ